MADIKQHQRREVVLKCKIDLKVAVILAYVTLHLTAITRATIEMT